MSQDHTGPQPTALGQDHLFRKLDELGSMHMRTREDMAEVKAEVKAIGASQSRVEKRQELFEQEIQSEIELRHKRANDQMREMAEKTFKRVDQIEGEVKLIREERIAEKAQWRGPEKVIALLIALAGGAGAIAALVNYLPHGAR